MPVATCEDRLDALRAELVKRAFRGVAVSPERCRSPERDGLVTRHVYAVVPPRVEYALAPLGRTLLRPLRAICLWAQEHLPEVRAARRLSERSSPL